jgi:hypothetical protein
MYHNSFDYSFKHNSRPILWETFPMIIGAIYVHVDGTEAILAYGDIQEDRYVLQTDSRWNFEGNFDTISALWEFKTK